MGNIVRMPLKKIRAKTEAETSKNSINNIKIYLQLTNINKIEMYVPKLLIQSIDKL